MTNHTPRSTSMKLTDKIYRHKKRSIYTLLMLSYVSILLLALSSNLIYYSQIRKQITSQTELSRQLLLTQLHTSVESDTAAIESLSTELAFDQNLYNYAKGRPNITYSDVKSSLSSKSHHNDVIYDYFVYIRNTDEIITPTLRMSSRQFYDIIYTFADLSYENFKEQYLDPSYFQAYLPLQRLNSYDCNEQTILPFIQTFPVDNSQEPLGQIICLIDADKMFSNADLIHQSTGSDVYILNEKNQIITTSEEAASLDFSVIDTFSTGKISEHSIISKQTADSTGWKFIIQTSKHHSFAENKQILFSFAVVFIFYLSAGLILVYFLTNKTYQPISEINNLIQNNRSADLFSSESQNEFQTIRNTIIHQFQQDKKLNNIIDHQIPYVRNSIFNRMLKGLVNDPEYALERLRELGLSFQSPYFLLISLEIDESSPFLFTGNNLEENLILARLVASNVGDELFNSQFHSYSLDYEQQKTLFVLCPHSNLPKEEIMDSAIEISAKLLNFLTPNHLFCYIGISAVHKVNDLPLCLDEACKASEYSRMLHASAPVLFEHMINLNNNYYYPPEMEYQLISSLKTGQFNQAKNLITKIFTLNTDGKNLSSNALKGLLFEINSTLIKQLSSMNIARGETPDYKISINSFDDIPSLDTALKKYFDIIDLISSKKMEDQVMISKPEKLSASIADYIENHAGEHWIDLNSLSEEFHVTPQYISNIFKKYQGENIKDCISKEKLTAAKKLLLTTEMSVNEIAQKLGYAGEIGIIRLFKKYEGMTPGDFRVLHQNNETTVN